MAYSGSLKHPDQGKVYRRIRRPDAAQIRTISQAYTGFLVDRLGKYGVVDPKIKPIDPSSRICGPAITALGPDLTVRRMAADLAEPGDILVISAGHTADYSLFGDGTALKMSMRGVKGVVIDGATRDVERIKLIGFPCFCMGVTLRNYDYPVFAQYGAVNVPVVVGGVNVTPGDLIIGDADGILVVPRKFVPALAAHVEQDYLSEARERVGTKYPFLFRAEAELYERGYVFIDDNYGE